MSKFTRVSKFLAAAQIFTISCENSKILSRLLSVLSLHRKFLHSHCCCPKSAVILHRLQNGGHPRLLARLPKSIHNPMGGGEGGALPRSSNPDNMAAGGARDAQCGEGGRWGRWRRGDLQQITAHSNSYPSFSSSFCPLCIRQGFDKNFARSSAEQLAYT
jgi:hypothetical protein